MADTKQTDIAKAAAAARTEPAPGAAKAKAAAKKQDAAKAMPGLRIVGPEGGFWRAGRRWGPEATDVPVDALTAKQIAQLKGEPKLMVAEIELPVE